MRKSYNNFNLVFENDVFIGVKFGSGFCSEHEWGIKSLLGKFGIIGDTHTKQIVDLKITSNNNLYFAKSTNNNNTVLTSRLKYSFSPDEDLKTFEKLLNYDLIEFSQCEVELRVAWDSEDFCLVSNTPHLETLMQEAMKFNVVIMVYENSWGLFIYDRIPKKTIQEREIFVKNSLLEEKIYSESGIAELKEKYHGSFKNPKKRYAMACSPKLSFVNGKPSLRFWFNYGDNLDNGYGWATLEQTKEWYSTAEDPNRLSIVEIWERDKAKEQKKIKIPKKVREQLEQNKK